MTISSEVRKAGPYVGNDVSTSFSFAFKVFSSGDVIVVLTNPSEEESILVEGDDYTVTLNDDQDTSPGGSIEKTSALADGYLLTVTSGMENLQPVEITNLGGFYPSVLNSALDRMTILIQQVSEQVDRAVKTPISSGLTPDELLASIVESDSEAAESAAAAAISANNASGFADDAETSALAAAASAITAAAEVGALAVSSGAALVGWIRSVAGSVSTTIAKWLGWQPTNVFEFMTDAQISDAMSGAPVLDHTAALQAAINSGEKRIVSKAGATYRITDALNCASNSVVIDFKKSTINLDDATGLKSHLILGDNATQKNGIEVRNVTFTRTQAATAGAAIDAQYVGTAKIVGCRVYGNNKIHNGISISRGMICEISGNYIDNCVNEGVYLVGTGDGADRTVDASIRENRIEGGSIGLKTWDFVEGVFCRDNIFFNQTTACASVSASTNANGLISFKFQENDFDTSAGVGLYLDMVSNVQVTGNWFSMITGTSLQIKDTVDSAIVSDNQIYPIADGIEIGGNSVRASNNLISGGGKSINVKSMATNTAVSGNTLSNSQHGLYLAENPIGVHVIGNNFINNSVGTISDHVTPNARTIQNNQGDSVIGSTSFITVGASPYVYTSGNRPEMVSVFSGTVSNIQIGGTSIGFSSNRTIMVPPRTNLTVTYSSIPFMTKTFF